MYVFMNSYKQLGIYEPIANFAPRKRANEGNIEKYLPLSLIKRAQQERRDKLIICSTADCFVWNMTMCCFTFESEKIQLI